MYTFSTSNDPGLFQSDISNYIYDTDRMTDTIRQGHRDMENFQNHRT